MATTRRTAEDLVRISATIHKENREWMEAMAESRGVSMSALLDSILVLYRRKMEMSV